MLSPHEMAMFRQLAAKAQASGQMVGPDMLATLTPPDTERRILSGVPYEEVPIAQPVPWLPVAKDIAWGLNDRVVTFTDSNINVEAITNLGFDIPSVVYALTASVRSTNGTPLPGTLGNVRDAFRIQFELSQGRKWQTSNAMGSAILGSAERPRMLGRPGWRFNNGATMLVKVTPLIGNLQIDIVLWTLEMTGPGNIATMPL